MCKRTFISLLAVISVSLSLAGRAGTSVHANSEAKPRVLVLAVNGAEWDLLRPLLIRGEMPNLKRVVEKGVYGKLRTISAPNCPKVFTAFLTGVAPEKNGITGFVVGGQTANTHMLKSEPIWSIMSKHGITVGMANVPATFPAMPLNGYMISGMLTTGKGCEDGILCAPKLSEVQGGSAVYPRSLIPELQANVGDFLIDCSRMPNIEDLQGKESREIDAWLAGVQRIRDQQTKLFEYLLRTHPTDFAMFDQSCEDRVGHWLYPIQPHNVGYNSKLHTVRVDAFPDQYRAFDKVLGTVLKYVDEATTLFIISDHGIKPLRELGDEGGNHQHGTTPSTTPVIAKHDFPDADDVPGIFIAMGPGIKKNFELLGWVASVFDIAPTVLHIYGIEAPKQMQGHVLSEIFESRARNEAADMRIQGSKDMSQPDKR